MDLLHHPWFFWVAFNAFVLLMLVLDLFVFHRHAHVIKFREALGWTAFWIALAAGFAVLVYLWHGPGRTLEFVTGYVIEESLSVDNLFVFLLIFRYFKVPAQYQHKVLFWGILGALGMRIVFIAAGVTLIRRFEWIIYLFGIFLIYAGAKLFRSEEMEIHPEHNPVLKLFRRRVRVTPDYVEGNFSVMRDGLRYFTPLAVVLLVVETTDVAFATDSIPAVLAITRDPFIVYTSNVFAILGLRSMYFALAGMMEIFHYLHYGLATVLMFVGAKMLLSHYFPIPVGAALAVIAVVLGLSVVASLLFPRQPKATEPGDETR
ncbi:MAG TPA: TerC family protein [Terriglobales bacterium]|nr:TerC family protein [Terriglobales bacterium]